MKQQKLKTKYYFTVKTAKGKDEKIYVKLAWAYKAYKKFIKYPNVIEVTLERDDNVHMRDIIFYYCKSE